MRADLIPMRLECGVVVFHTRAQYEAFFKGVDVEACAAMEADIDDYLDDEDTED